MKRLFVSLELAIKLKEKGFNEPCMAYYGKQDTMMGLLYYTVYNGNAVELEWSIAKPHEKHLNVYAPLYQQVVDWFRETHKIWIEIIPLGDLDNWKHQVHETSGNFKIHQDYSKSYYEALGKAIKDALNLI